MHVKNSYNGITLYPKYCVFKLEEQCPITFCLFHFLTGVILFCIYPWHYWVIPCQINRLQTSCQESIPIFGLNDGFWLIINKKKFNFFFEMEHLPKNWFFFSMGIHNDTVCFRLELRCIQLSSMGIHDDTVCFRLE